MKTLLVTLIVVSVLSCSKNPEERGVTVIDDMVHSPAYEAYSENPVTPSGHSMLPPVSGSIARGKMPHAYGKSEADAIKAGEELQDPYPESERSLKRGAYLYQSFCVSCHGTSGEGDGPVSQKKFPAPPSLKGKRVSEFSKARIYHVITVGFGDMPAHGSQLTIEDRWYLSQYVKQMAK